MAGPSILAAWNCAEFSEMALSSVSRGTRSGTIACHAGKVKAMTQPVPTATAMIQATNRQSPATRGLTWTR